MSVDREMRGQVLVVTLNRPERRNALDMATIRGIGEAFTEAEHDDAVRAVVLTGAGDRAFCAGMDLKDFAEAAGGGDDAAASDEPGVDALLFRFFPKPVVAAVNGAAVAGGFELVLACDVVVAAEHATFGLPEVKRGLVPGGGGTRLSNRLPFAIALELGLTGDTIDASRAAALGLVNYVVPGPEVLDAAIALAERIAANGPLAVGVTKQLMYEEIGARDQAKIERIAELIAPVFASEDALEGAMAFAEKRPAQWKGR